MTDSKTYGRKRDRLLMLLAGLYFFGTAVGTFLYCTLDDEKIKILDSISGSFVTGRLHNTFWQTLVNSFSGGFILLVVCFLMGFCAAAQPAEMLIPFFRGIGTGASIAGFYSGYGVKGAGAAAVLIVPSAVAAAFVMIIAAREAFYFSGSLYAAAFGKKSTGDSLDVRLYFTKFVILCTMLAAASAVDSLITFATARFWTELLGI
ncbi:MAG: hypothetical protein J1F11_11465 [Oscillospiraceae bacterium]|nr:hypothetical protein [Oscillospiraceae bacterium]